MRLVNMRIAILSLLSCCAWAQTNTVSVTVHVGSPSVTIPPDFLGLSFESGSLTTTTGFPAENSQFRQMLTQLGTGWLRFGGNSVDKTAWTSGTASGSLTPAAVDRVAALARATGWRVVWGLGLANSSAATDAGEADYVLTHAGDVVSGLEIGNEPDLFSRNGFMPATLPDYLTAWGQYSAAIKALHADAPFAGPADSGNINTWTSQFATQYGSQVALLTQHFYPLGPVGVVAAGAPNEATIANLLGTTTHSAAQSTGLEMTAIAQKAKVPWRMGETNSCYNGGQPGVSDVFASALWGIDYMMTLAGTSAAGVNFHGGGTGTYTPIAVSTANGTTSISARPLYYAMLLFGAAARGRVLPVDVNSGRVNLTAFAIQDADGTVRVVLINKDLSSSVTAQIGSTISTAFSNATVMRLSAPSLTATSGITLGGSAVASDGTWSPSQYENVIGKSGVFSVDVPAGSAAVVGLGNAKIGIGNTASGSSTVAPNSMASLYGQNLGFVSRSTPSTNLPASLAGISATVTDSTGATRTAPLIYVAPSQINIVMPAGTAAGTATIAVGASNGTVQVAPVAPGLFGLGGTKVAAATAARYPNDGSAASPVAVFDCSSGTCQTTPIAVDTASSVYVSLYGTGLRGAANVTCTVGGVAAPAQFAAQGQYPGLDQVNIQLPSSLQGRGVADVVVTADGRASNAVQIEIQ